jgi:hypothetical protein
MLPTLKAEETKGVGVRPNFDSSTTYVRTVSLASWEGVLVVVENLLKISLAMVISDEIIFLLGGLLDMVCARTLGGVGVR